MVPIEGIDWDGFGVTKVVFPSSRYEACTLKVKGAVPGDTVRVVVATITRMGVRGLVAQLRVANRSTGFHSLPYGNEAESVVGFETIKFPGQKNSDDVVPDSHTCPHFNRSNPELSCGGCMFPDMKYGAQLVAKLKLAKDSLKDLAGLSEELLRNLSIVPSPSQHRFVRCSTFELISTESGKGPMLVQKSLEKVLNSKELASSKLSEQSYGVCGVENTQCQTSPKLHNVVLSKLNTLLAQNPDASSLVSWKPKIRLISDSGDKFDKVAIDFVIRGDHAPKIASQVWAISESIGSDPSLSKFVSRVALNGRFERGEVRRVGHKSHGRLLLTASQSIGAMIPNSSINSQIADVIASKKWAVPDDIMWNLFAGSGHLAVDVATLCGIKNLLCVEENPHRLEDIAQNTRMAGSQFTSLAILRADLMEKTTLRALFNGVREAKNYGALPSRETGADGLTRIDVSEFKEVSDRENALSLDPSKVSDSNELALVTTRVKMFGDSAGSGPTFALISDCNDWSKDPKPRGNTSPDFRRWLAGIRPKTIVVVNDVRAIRKEIGHFASLDYRLEDLVLLDGKPNDTTVVALARFISSK